MCICVLRGMVYLLEGVIQLPGAPVVYFLSFLCLVPSNAHAHVSLDWLHVVVSLIA